MVKYIIVFIALAGFLAGCAGWLGDYPTVCTDTNKQASLRTWANDKYGIIYSNESSVLCDIASKNGIHLDYTGDLILAADLVTIRKNENHRQRAVEFYATIRDSAVIGNGVLTGADFSAHIFKLMADYPELGLVALPLLNKLKVNTDMLSAKDGVMILWWCDRNIDVLNG